MKLSAQMNLVIAVVFALVCFGFAINGFSSLPEMTDSAQIADAKGFAWFWTFLGSVGVVLGALSFWIARTQRHRDDA
ncbi:MAG TPA: hypothetical protein VKF40_30925 [Burkholderiales bacterium]|nr:hypothetical protein [Burkholderiales bacterium]